MGEPDSALKSPSISSTPSIKSSSSSITKKILPAIGTVINDIAKGSENFKIPIINHVNRDLPTVFDYKNKIPDIGPESSHLTDGLRQQNIKKKILEIQTQKVNKMNKT